MAVLRAAVALVALVGCYRPDTRDCTVSCQGADDCIAGQVCGADGWCAAPSLAGSCGEASVDAAADRDGDPTIDAEPAIDAEPIDPDAATAALHLIVSGRGKVVVEPLGVDCEGTQGTPGDCTFGAPPDTEVTLLPVDTHPQDTFTGWTTDNCSASPAACVLTIEAPVTLVGASFD